MLPRTPPAAEPPTERIPIDRTAVAPLPRQAPPATPPPADPRGPADRPERSDRPRRGRRGLLIGAGAVVLLALVYGGDLALTSGNVPRGVTVAGVDVGGLDPVAAEQRLRADIEPRATQAIPVSVGDATSELAPAAAGLTVDWQGTLDRAGSQPLNPITRITSLFTTREVGIATATDQVALESALTELAPTVDREPVEGAVRFDDTTPVGVDPVPGQHLDVPAAVTVLENRWIDGTSVDLPITPLPTETTPEDVATAVDTVARPAVSGPVTVAGENGATGTIEPEVVAEALSFRADGGDLLPELNPEIVTEALKDSPLAASERPGRDAELTFNGTTPQIVESQDGRGIDYEATLTDLMTVLTGDGPREITAVYADQPAKVTTADIQALGIVGEIGTYTTKGFAADSGRNIRRAAELVDGTIVKPGEIFSLDQVTGPRSAANGYVEAGIIEDGAPGRGIAGGVSQVATTTYNAAYFAGMEIVEHKPHSFYISRYPEARESTIVEGRHDMRFRNDGPAGVLIKTAWTPSTITVTLYGTKRFDVKSETSGRSNPTQPKTLNKPPGAPCSASQGAPGFTVTDTRVLTNLATGAVSREPRTWKYNPIPIVVCG